MTDEARRDAQPFVGPRPFTEVEEALFFGRDREIVDLRALVTAHRVVLLYAQSGAGKSSLIHAGLLPELKEQGFEALPVARVGSHLTLETPSSTGNVFVDNVLSSWAAEVDEATSHASIAEFLADRPHHEDKDGFPQPRVAVLDQFEELFTTHPEHWESRAAFLTQMAEALEADPLLRVVFAIREDYLAKLDPLARHLPDRLRFRYRLELLQERAAVVAISKPLSEFGRSIDSAAAESLVERLLQTRVESDRGEPQLVRGQYVEPVQLQVVCQRLWTELPPDETRITQELVAKLGPLHEILGRFYDEGIRRAAARVRVSEKRLRNAFEGWFITSAGTRGFVHREKRQTAGVPNAALSVLENRRLLRSEWRAGAQWYEIPHDSLVESIRRSNDNWRRQRQKRKRIALALVTILVAASGAIAAFFLRPQATAPPNLDIAIVEVSVLVDAPLEISFGFANRSATPLEGLAGTVTVADEEGTYIDSFSTGMFSAQPHETVSVTARSWWASLVPGEYAIGILLDLGASGSLAASQTVSIVAPVVAVPSEWDNYIRDVEIISVVPVEVSFEVFGLRLPMRPQQPQLDESQFIRGNISILDQLGNAIARVPIESFSLQPSGTKDVTAQIGLEFLEVGLYVVEISLTSSTADPVSKSLAFRVLPVQLPLEAIQGAGGAVGQDAGLYTVYQTPLNWGVEGVRATEAWMITHGSEDVVVAVIDSGIDWSIDQLSESMWTNLGEIPDNGIDDDRNGYVDDIHGWDFRDDDASALVGSMLHMHGTFVAGVIAARPGRFPIVGIAPGVKLMDVRFLDSNNSFRSSDWGAFVDAINYATDNGADIINLSIYSSGRPPSAFEEALARAIQQDVIIVGMTGNSGRDVPYPGSYDSVLAVSAVDDANQLSSFSGRGPETAFCAPGEEIVSLGSSGLLTELSGTSIATPHVSGVLALILSAAPDLTPAEAVAVLETSAQDLGEPGRDSLFGFGLVDAARALLSLNP